MGTGNCETGTSNLEPGSDLVLRFEIAGFAAVPAVEAAILAQTDIIFAKAN